jgi:hypothetical protein
MIYSHLKKYILLFCGYTLNHTNDLSDSKTITPTLSSIEDLKEYVFYFVFDPQIGEGMNGSAVYNPDSIINKLKQLERDKR